MKSREEIEQVISDMTKMVEGGKLVQQAALGLVMQMAALKWAIGTGSIEYDGMVDELRSMAAATENGFSRTVSMLH